MRRLDKMTKLLLGLIALFLGVIALKPVLKITPAAHAQTGTAPSSISAGTSSADTVAPVSGVKLLNRIVTRDAIQGVEAMDNSGVFLVWTRNTVEIYRLD